MHSHNWYYSIRQGRSDSFFFLDEGKLASMPADVLNYNLIPSQNGHFELKSDKGRDTSQIVQHPKN